MPTPESELFLAKKPKVAPTFDGVDYEDNTALKGAQDAIIREQWVRSMMARLVRDEMGKCYRREGVNHLEKCGHLRGMDALSYEERLVWNRLQVLWPGFALGYKERRGWGHAMANTNPQSDTLSCSRTPRSRDTFSRSRTMSTNRTRSNRRYLYAVRIPIRMDGR
jgi:hypothetical protein